MDLSLTILAERGHTVVAVTGEIDAHTAPELHRALNELVERGDHHLIVDLDDVGFLDSTALSVLIEILQQVRARQGTLRLVATQEPTIKIFRITGLTSAFPFHDNVAAALADANDPGAQQRDRAPGQDADVLQ